MRFVCPPAAGCCSAVRWWALRQEYHGHPYRERNGAGCHSNQQRFDNGRKVVDDQPKPRV